MGPSNYRILSFPISLPVASRYATCARKVGQEHQRFNPIVMGTVETGIPTTLDIHLDRSLQIWVLLPIFLATLLMGMVRRNVSSLMLSEPKSNILKNRDANLLKRSKRLRMNYTSIPFEQFEARRNYFVNSETGVLRKPPQQLDSISALMDPESLANQVVSVLISVVPHMLLGTWARYLYAGVAVCRLPFTLTPRFRGMLQSGMEMGAQNLDVSYVSSLSWYILNLFGNAGLLSLISSGKEDDIFLPSAATQIAMNVKPDKIFEEERTALIKIKHSCRLDDIEEALLQVDPNQFAL